MNGSAKRICRAAAKAPTDQSLVFLAHNGPTGSLSLVIVFLSATCFVGCVHTLFLIRPVSIKLRC